MNAPMSVKHYGAGNMQKLQAEAAKDGVVWLTVISSASGDQGHVSAAEADKLTAEPECRPGACRDRREEQDRPRL